MSKTEQLEREVAELRGELHELQSVVNEQLARTHAINTAIQHPDKGHGGPKRWEQ